MEHAALLATRNVDKYFGPNRVLRRVSFDLRAGEVHVLAGANGAGKTSLLRILSGADVDFDGDVLVGGAPVRFGGPRDARRAGIRAIHQELSLVGALRVVDNLFLVPEGGGSFARIARRDERARAAALLASLDIAVDPDALVEQLPIAMQQLVEIARALAADARAVIMDEPTSALSEPEAMVLFERIRALRDGGRGIIYVSHRLEEIYALADRITVLRDGARVGTASPAELPREQLVAWMAGESGARAAAKPRSRAGGSLLEIDDLRVPARSAADRFDVRGVALKLGRGEIVGLAGLRGSGTTALLEGLFGARRATGRVMLEGRSAGMRSPGRSLEEGLAYVSNDRRTAGLVLDRSVIENAALATLRRFSRFGWILRGQERAAVTSILGELGLRAAALDGAVRTLSGGNQQKVFLGRSLLAEPKVLLLNEPTRGVDVAAKADIHAELRQRAGAGAALLWYSAELDELLAACDRIVVMHAGLVTADLPRADATRARILEAAMSPERVV